jgi:hypothetical protein
MSSDQPFSFASNQEKAANVIVDVLAVFDHFRACDNNSHVAEFQHSHPERLFLEGSQRSSGKDAFHAIDELLECSLLHRAGGREQRSARQEVCTEQSPIRAFSFRPTQAVEMSSNERLNFLNRSKVRQFWFPPVASTG